MQKIYLFILSTIYLLSFADNGIVFKENKNQWPSHVLFGADYKTTKFFVNNNGFNFCIYNGNDLHKAHEARHDSVNSTQLIKGHNYHVVFNNASFLNANKINPVTEYYNYFIGNDKSKWAGNVKAYEELLFSNIYPNIDLKLYSNNGDIKYDMILRSHADISQIQLNYKNINGLTIKNGNLIIETSIGHIIEQKPYAYQIIKGKKVEVICQYQLNNNSVVYTLPNGHNKNYELIIDPTIVVCSYGNSTAWSNCSAASHDDFGNIFVLGLSEVGYPTTSGAFQTIYDSLYDISITKYNSTGTTKIFSTYLGGNKYELIQNAIVSATDITLFGATHSSNFPVTTNAFDTTFNDTTGLQDFFVSKLDLTGSSLIASTYIGGSNNDGVYNATGSSDVQHVGNMVIDKSGNVYISGSTRSFDFPVSTNAFQSTKNTGVDNIACKLDPTLQTLLFSTFFGGAGSENAFSSVLINGNELLITGTTLSTNFPTTPGSICPLKNPGSDMYILHLNSTGTNIIAATYLGTNTFDHAYLIDIDLNNNIYLCGYTGTSSSFNSTPGIYSINNAKYTLHKLNPSLSSIIFKTKFGSQNLFDYTAFKVDSCQNIYIAGFTYSANLPVTTDKFQNHNQMRDLYVTVFNANMLSLKFASYFGGRKDEHTDGGISYFSKEGVLYQGICSNGDLPTTSGAFQTTLPTADSTYYNDAFVKIDFQNFVQTNSSYGADVKGCVPFTANFNSFTNTGSMSWDFGDGSPISNQQNTTHLYNTVDTYTVYLIANDSTTCNKTDTVKSLIKIINPSQFTIIGKNFICDDQSVILKSETNDLVSYSWNTGATTNTISVNTEGTYTATINNGGCDSKQTFHVRLADSNINAAFPNVVTPNNDKANDVIDLGKYHFTQSVFTVFDRWGKEKFKTDKIDGIFDPANYNDGTYFYTLNYITECSETEIKTKGFITVFK